MDSDVKQSADIFQLVAWAHTNRKPLITISTAVAVVGLGIGLYVWNTNRRETTASEALSDLKISARASQAGPAVDDYLKIANEYTGTTAGARALLLAGATLFDTGKFSEAERYFTRFLQDYPDYPLASQAQLGVAASLEAEGKTADATTKYKEFKERHPSDPSMPQAMSALARLYEGQGKPDLALKLYEEMAKVRGNDSWSEEAGIQAEELLAKHPELRPAPVPAPMATPAPMMLKPTATATPAPKPTVTAAPPAATSAIPLTIPSKP